MGDEKFKGFELPKTNYSKLPHALIEALARFSSLAELKVVLYILRHTWGYQEFEEFKRITLDEFQGGRRRKDRSRLDDGTGMSKDAIRRGIKRAIEDGFIIQVSDTHSRPGLPAHCYQLNILKVSTLEASNGSKSVLEVLKVSSSSEKDTLERNSKKEKDTLLSSSKKTIVDQIIEQTETHPSPEDLARITEEKQAEVGNYADPAHAGGDDLAASCAYTLFCEMQEQMPTAKERGSMILELSEILKPTEASIKEIETAFEIMAQDFVYRVGNYNVFQVSFKQDLKTCIARARGQKVKQGRPHHQPENALLSQEALRERQAAQPASPQDDTVGRSIKDLLQAYVMRPTFVEYVKPCRFACDDGALVITAPNANKRDWLENRLGVTIERALAGVTDGPRKVVFEARE